MYQVFTSKAKWVAAAAIAALVTPMGAAMAAPSVDDIIAKHVDATGGKDGYAAVKSSVSNGQFLLIDMGMSATLTSHTKGANYKQTISVEGMGEITQGITDGVVWQLHFMEGDSILEGDAADAVVRQADLNAWGNWKNYFASAEVAGEEDGDYKVVFKAKGDGGDSTAYFDKETGLLDKLESAGPDGSPAIMTFSDYKDVGGISLAHKTEIESGMNIEMLVDSVELNGDISDDVFALPEVIQTLIPAEEEGITAAGIMDMMDADGDGKITMEEAPEQLQGSFAMVDLNGDEGIDVEEAQLIADFMNNQ
ncbi:MAG: hypothetical protein VCD00_08200 [Candidatus Hydrogenedentota bacterium]